MNSARTFSVRAGASGFGVETRTMPYFGVLSGAV